MDLQIQELRLTNVLVKVNEHEQVVFKKHQGFQLQYLSTSGTDEATPIVVLAFANVYFKEYKNNRAVPRSEVNVLVTVNYLPSIDAVCVNSYGSNNQASAIHAFRQLTWAQKNDIVKHVFKTIRQSRPGGLFPFTQENYKKLPVTLKDGTPISERVVIGTRNAYLKLFWGKMEPDCEKCAQVLMGADGTSDGHIDASEYFEPEALPEKDEGSEFSETHLESMPSEDPDKLS